MKIIFTPIVVGLLLLGCDQKVTETKKETIIVEPETSVTLTLAQYKAANIAFGKIERRVIGTSIQVNGSLEVPPQNLISISAPMGGFVKSTNLLPGMAVKKGSLLATLENQEYIQLQQDYLDSKSQLEFLDAEYKRQMELAKENINAQKSLQQAKAQYESMAAVVNGLEARLTLINIVPTSLKAGTIKSSISLYAPIDGFISAANVTTGEFVNATDVMYKIVNLDHMHVTLQVYEKDIDKLAIGQKVIFQLVNGKESFGATILLIGKEISPERTVVVHCHPDKENKLLLPGMFVMANIVTDATEANVVPSHSLVNFEGENILFLKDSDDLKFKMVAVKIGSTMEEFTEIQVPEGFKSDSEIVTTGAFEILGVLKNSEESE